MTPSDRPAYGRRLVPTVLDELGKKDPHRVYAAIPRPSDVKNGYRDVTIADLVRCVDFMSRWLEDKFGRSDSFETITYIGLPDLRGPATFLAAIKAGYKTGSTKVLYASELAPLARSLQSISTAVSIDVLLSFQEMLDSDPEPYPYDKSFDEARDDPIVILHSSGSTSLPKPITYTHGTLAAHDNDHNLPVPAGREKMDSTIPNIPGERRLYVMLPFFHLGGFIFYIDHAILNTASLVLGPPLVPPDAALFKDIAGQLKLRGIMTVPALLVELLHNSIGMKLLENLDFVICAGAPLSTAAGDKIKDLVRLVIFIGSTETLPLPELFKSPEDWEYREFNPNFKHEMQLFDSHVGTYELVIFADESNKDAAPLYHSLPGVNPYHTKDLFTRHPEKPLLFKYYGRKDDILVLGNGEKVNPIPLEQYVQGHPAVKGAIVVGNGRIQTALLVEPREALEASEHAEYLRMLWAQIKESNAYIPGQGRITQDKVICALPDKPFIRAGKGTIIRRATEEIYQREMERLYSNSSPQDEDHVLSISLEPTLEASYEPAKIISFLRQVIAVSFAPASSIEEKEDLFSYGLDSLQTLEIVANLKRSLERLTSNTVSWISPRTIFYNSTLVNLSNLLTRFLNDGVIPGDSLQAELSATFNETVAWHIQHLPGKRVAPLTSAPSMEMHTVALIGSTGYLGSYPVAALVMDPKLLYLETRLGAPLLGLSQEKYDLIACEVDVIIYNAWKLDFGHAIRSFEPFLKATRDLVDLSAASKRNMRVVFISSISSVEGLATKTIVPEAPVDDPYAPMNTGYGQSKLAAERILVAANQQSGVPVTVVRVGQVGGPSQGGAWADQLWLSALLRTSRTLGCFPGPVAPVDWVAVDVAAAMLQRFALRPAEEQPQVFNVVAAPESAQPWDLLLDAARELTGAAESEFQIVPLRDWVEKLRDVSDPNPRDVADSLPALKLLDFYEMVGSGTSQLRYETGRAREVSGVEVPAVDRQLLVSWLKSWNL
ncbi:acetyl-CoA synthetase-like protein [Hypoxylon sp. FL1284]|nr:acetyl-CoA synthetase-like protein [Hypoxylon sp. FL1284]